MAVGLQRAAALARHDNDGAIEVLRQGRLDLRRIGGVEDGELDAVGSGDDLGGER